MDNVGSRFVRRLPAVLGATAIGVLLIGLVVGTVWAATVTIDNFDSGVQTVRADDGGEYGTYNSHTRDTTAALGGERDVAVTWDSGNGSPVAVLIDTGIGVGTNQLKFDQGSGILGYAEVVWDGNDSDADTLDTDGLGGDDLTDGNTNDGVQLLVYEGDGAFDLGMWVYSNTTTAYYTLTMVTDVDPPGQSFFIPFTDFSGSQSVFESAGAVVFRISPHRTAVDLTLDLFEATANKDFGDLPDDYGITTVLSDGARHVISGTPLYLGSIVDREATGFPSSTATGDNENNYNDEDGITITRDLNWTPGTVVTVTADVYGSGGYLVGWFDWDEDDVITETGEMITFGSTVSGTNYFTLTVPAAFDTPNTVNNLYARFRLYRGNPGTPSVKGQVTGGEVEDYRWQFGPTAVTLRDLDARATSSGLWLLPAGLALTVAAAGVWLVARRRRA